MTEWDERWRQGDTGWDKGRAAPPLLEFLESAGPDFVRGLKVLVPGCGAGHDVRALAAAGAEVVGIDLSPHAIEVAESFPKQANEKFLAADFFTWQEQQFDMVWEHTFFCAIEPSNRSAYAKQMSELVTPGGHLLGVFYLDPWGPDEDPTPPPFGATSDEIESLLGSCFTKVSEARPSTSFEGREGKEWLALFKRQLPERGIASSSLAF